MVATAGISAAALAWPLRAAMRWIGEQPGHDDDAAAAGARAEPVATVARQPICDLDGRIRAYELLFRDADGRSAREVGGTTASASAIISAIADIGLRTVTGGHPAWINVTRELLGAGLVDALPLESAVLEILEDEPIDDELVALVERVVHRGATVALDDFQYSPAADPLLRLARWVKIDVRAVGTDGFVEQVGLLRRFGIGLLAEKVETQNELEACRRGGATLFQGYVFARPRTIERRTIRAGQAARLELIRRINDPAVAFDELQRIVTQDVALSYRFLRYVNSAIVGLPREITSIREALVLVGLDRVRRWATLVAAAHLAPTQPDLLMTALIRAHMCAHIARRRGADENAAYTVGLLSLLDVLLDQPMSSIVQQVPLALAVGAALASGQGPLGDILGTVVDYERGHVADAELGAAFAVGVREAAEALR